MRHQLFSRNKVRIAAVRKFGTGQPVFDPSRRALVHQLLTIASLFSCRCFEEDMAMVMIRCPAFEVQAFAGIDKLRVALHFWVLAPQNPGFIFF